MKRFLTVLLFSTAACAAHADRGDSVILWMFNDPAISEVDGLNMTSAANLVGRGLPEGEEPDAAVRVVMVTSDGHHYLDLWADDERRWGDSLFLPTIQSEGGSETEVWTAGPTRADISGYSASVLQDPGTSFMIELGRYTEDGNWIVLAASQAENMGNLIDRGHVFSADLDAQGQNYWTGGSYAVPEPSSGLLLLIGGGLLSLRRRRRPQLLAA